MSPLYLPREYLHDFMMAVLFQVHFRLREEPIEYSHRERKTELDLNLPPSYFVLTSCPSLGHTPTTCHHVIS
jgi:hypothetical protein